MTLRAALELAGGAFFACVALSAVACSGNEERGTPNTSTCTAHCYTPFPGSKEEGGSGTGGAAGRGGQGGEPEGVTLTGTVALLNGDDFEFADAFAETVDLRAPAADGTSATGVWTGSVSEPFVIEGVKSDPALWVHGEPRTSGNDALPTLEPMATDEPDDNGVVSSEFPFALVRASVIDQIFSVLATPLGRDDGKAQVVLKLVGGNPLSGVAGVTVTAPRAEVVIYAINNSFSEIPTETDSTGIVVLANVAASSWPGALVDVTFTGAATSGAELRVVTSAVTLATVEP